MVSATSQPYLVSVSMRVQYFLTLCSESGLESPSPRVDGVVLLVHAYPHRDRNHAGLRSSIFRWGRRLRAHDCDELVFDSQGTNGLSASIAAQGRLNLEY
jgi:hypothetical protein